MCTTCNSTRNGCYDYATPISTNGCGGFAYGQRLCRDCNGNIRVMTANTGCNVCCCPCYCHCCGGCGGGNNGVEGNNGATSGNGNGGYGCVTICGAAANTTTAANMAAIEEYYARQYAWNRRNGRSSCGCGCNGD